MCSIIASYNKEKIKELVKINQHRGNFSYSISVFKDGKLIESVKNFGVFNENILNETSEGYIICHLQAPTSGLVQDLNRIHPTQINNSYLYHNGIITSRGMKYIQAKLASDETFDTKLLHNQLYNTNFCELSNIEGLFSCLYIKEHKIYIFRTKHGKLYMDDDLTISSEKFKNSKCINSDNVYELDIINKKVNIIDNFKTLRYNIVIPGEL